VSEWIDVKQELPETRVKVIAYRKGVYVMAFREELEHARDSSVDGSPTRWMPLPAPPEEEKK